MISCNFFFFVKRAIYRKQLIKENYACSLKSSNPSLHGIYLTTRTTKMVNKKKKKVEIDFKKSYSLNAF